MNITDISTQIKSQERKISILNNLNTAIVACATASIGLDIEKTNRLIEKLNKVVKILIPIVNSQIKKFRKEKEGKITSEMLLIEAKQLETISDAAIEYNPEMDPKGKKLLTIYDINNIYIQQCKAVEKSMYDIKEKITEVREEIKIPHKKAVNY